MAMVTPRTREGRTRLATLAPTTPPAIEPAAMRSATVPATAPWRMNQRVAVALIATLALGFLVVEITLRWFGQRS